MTVSDECFSILDTAALVPQRDAACEHPLSGASVESSEDRWVEMNPF